MQKHEREVLDAAREEADKFGLTVEIVKPRGPKRRLILSGPGGTRFKQVSSSPKDIGCEIDHTRRWVRNIGRELS